MSTNRQGRIAVYPRAFRQLDYYEFGSSLVHEAKHVKQFRGWRGGKVDVGSQVEAMWQAEAYAAMLDSSQNKFYSGLSVAGKISIGRSNEAYGIGLLETPHRIAAENGDFSVVGLSGAP